MVTTAEAATQAAMPGVSPYRPTVDAHPDSGSLHDQWALAQWIAGRKRARIGVNIGGRFQYKVETALTLAQPVDQVLAASIYDRSGYCRTLCFDLDTKHHCPADVLTQATSLTRVLADAGLRSFHDISPNGGRHVYVPLKKAIHRDYALDLVTAAAVLFPAIDPSPHGSVPAGCIRTPGARHKTGGHQQLTVALSAAYDMLRRPNMPEALTRFEERLAAPLHQVRKRRMSGTLTDGEIAVLLNELEMTRSRTYRLSPTMSNIAVDGLWDPTRYATSSEARQAVMVAAVAAGYDLDDIARLMADGTWAGLRYLYRSARPSDPAQRTKLTRNEYGKAVRYVSAHQTDSQVQDSYTRESSQGDALQPRSGSEHGYIRMWRSVADSQHTTSLAGPGLISARWLMRTLAAAAHKRGDRRTNFGVRSLAEGCGLDASTVGSHLHELDQRGWVERIDEALGPHADVWELTIPAELLELAGELPLQDGHVRELPAVFHRLGHLAAWVFDAVHLHGARTITSVERTAGVSKRSTINAVQTLTAVGLLERTPDGLAARPEQLEAVARQLGAFDLIASRHARHRAERDQWRAWLAEMAAAGFDVVAPGDPIANAHRDELLAVAA